MNITATPRTGLGCAFLSLALLATIQSSAFAHDFTVVDTDQETCYDVTAQIPPPAAGEAFYGQDAQYFGPQPCYRDNGDGTVTDLVTGLMWQQGPGDKMTYDEAVLAAASFQLAGYDDWRLPSIKELYSLILFSGIDPSGWEGSDPSSLVPFLDTDYFQFQYGDPDAGERLIDAQYWSATQYVGTTMNGDATTFGVNFADGRIKGYPSEPVGPPGNQFTMTGFVKYVRGPSGYGVNSFVDNGDGTVTDLATGLMWQRDDNGTGQCWQEALAYAETLTQGGYDDWRLPDAKELQSIVDYTRSPSTSGSAAIDPVFSCSSIVDEGGETNYPFYWTGTTHANWTDDEGQFGVYVAFGEALGFMESPPNSGNYVLMDVHGAGAQRSDPKEGNPEDYPHGHGPQGDVVRIYNFVRCVRGRLQGIDLSATRTGEEMQLVWTARPEASEYWLYGAHEHPYFEPGLAPDFHHRIAIIANDTTWVTGTGVGDPTENWIYQVLAVNASSDELCRSNRAGEYEFGSLPQ